MIEQRASYRIACSFARGLSLGTQHNVCNWMILYVHGT